LHRQFNFHAGLVVCSFFLSFSGRGFLTSNEGARPFEPNSIYPQSLVLVFFEGCLNLLTEKDDDDRTGGSSASSTFSFVFAGLDVTRLWEVAKLGRAAVSLLAGRLNFLNFRYCGTGWGPSSDLPVPLLVFQETPLCDGINWWETLLTF
jgi:hypothetical protein